uniref:Decapping nuclease n=1 Tax=Panagrolaimus sp. ES5 TaxID=591445 RepID=A0AC34F550_9BILA
MEEDNYYFAIDKNEKCIFDFDKSYVKEYVSKDELKESGKAVILTPLLKPELKDIRKNFKKQSIITKRSCLRKLGELELFRCQKHKNGNKWKMSLKKIGEFYDLQDYGNGDIDKDSDDRKRYESFKEFMTGISEKKAIKYFRICSRQFHRNHFVYYSAEIDGWKKKGDEPIEMNLQNMNMYERLNYSSTFCTTFECALTNIETIIFGFHGNNELQELEEYTIDELKNQVKFQATGNCYDVDKGLDVIDKILRHLIKKFKKISSELKRENFTLIINFDGEKCAQKLKLNESMSITDFLSYEVEK